MREATGAKIQGDPGVWGLNTVSGTVVNGKKLTSLYN